MINKKMCWWKESKSPVITGTTQSHVITDYHPSFFPICFRVQSASVVVEVVSEGKRERGKGPFLNSRAEESEGNILGNGQSYRLAPKPKLLPSPCPAPNPSVFYPYSSMPNNRSCWCHSITSIIWIAYFWLSFCFSGSVFPGRTGATHSRGKFTKFQFLAWYGLFIIFAISMIYIAYLIFYLTLLI